MARKLRYYDENKRIIPYKKTTYQKRKGKWFVVNEETGLSSRAILNSEIKSKVLLPFEDRHRKEKRQRYRHDYPFDTFTSYKGDKKSVLFFDVEQGEKNYHRLAEKSYYDRQRYKRLKNKK